MMTPRQIVEETVLTKPEPNFIGKVGPTKGVFLKIIDSILSGHIVSLLLYTP